jgi:hypothetical protein
MPNSEQFPNQQSVDLESTEVMPFDWRKLMALGLSNHETHRLTKTLVIREMVPAYWRRLIESGVPMNEARSIAKAIANYDADQKRPSFHQRELILRYHSMVYKANLWRPQLPLQ